MTAPHLRLAALALLALLPACAPTGPGPARAPAATTPRFADAAPHPWRGESPQNHPVQGIDVSRFQPAIDWPMARAAGVSFAYIKATEGGDLLDPMFRTHWRDAGRAQVPRGAYHFFYHCRPALEQARWFIRHVPRTPAALPPVLDLEWTPFSPTCTQRRDGATIRAEARRFLAALKAHYRQQPIIYTSPDFFRDTELWKLEGASFWLRSVAAHPQQSYPGQRWIFWQYTSTGLVPGVSGPVDINAFEGSLPAWRAWRAAAAPAR